MKSSTFRWTNDISKLRNSMTRGNAGIKEKYWYEEEAYLLRKYENKIAGKTLSVGSGFFRELSTLIRISSNFIVGIEIESDIIQATKNEISKIVFSNAQQVLLIQGDAIRFPICSSVFDLVLILYQGLGNIVNPIKAMDEMIRLCSPHGTVVISVWNEDESTTNLRKKIYSQQR